MYSSRSVRQVSEILRRARGVRGGAHKVTSAPVNSEDAKGDGHVEARTHACRVAPAGLRTASQSASGLRLAYIFPRCACESGKSERVSPCPATMTITTPLLILWTSLVVAATHRSEGKRSSTRAISRCSSSRFGRSFQPLRIFFRIVLTRYECQINSTRQIVRG